jgi:hypothetical protein
MLIAGGWGPEAEQWELSRRRMFEEALDVPALASSIRKLLDAWPESQGTPPFPLVAMDRALHHWPRIRDVLSADEEVKQTDLVGTLELGSADVEALRYLVYVLSGCGVLQKRTLKNRVHVRLQGEAIDLSSLREHWTDAWACPGTSFNLAWPTYKDLDPRDHQAMADLLSFDGRDIFEKTAPQDAVNELNRVDKEFRQMIEAADGNSTRAVLKADKSMRSLLMCLDSKRD